MSSFLVIDLQGFKNSNNSFIIKELALATAEMSQVFLIKPPYPYTTLTKDEKRQVNWIENNRKIFWSEGYIDAREFKRIVAPFLENRKIYVKGLEKMEWVKEICKNCDIVNVEDIGCPNLTSLHNNYCKMSTSMNCISHKKECALKNVLCIKKWFFSK